MQYESVAGRYAEALFQVADKAGKIDRIRDDLERVNALLDSNPELKLAIESPVVHLEVKKNIIDRIVTGWLGNEVRNLLFIMADKGRLPYLKAVQSEYDALVRKSKGILLAEVELAIPIDEELKKRLAQAIADWKGKAVQLKTTVKPDILGGVIVRIDDNMVDGSLRGQLMELVQNFKKKIP